MASDTDYFHVRGVQADVATVEAAIARSGLNRHPVQIDVDIDSRFPGWQVVVDVEVLSDDDAERVAENLAAALKAEGFETMSPEHVADLHGLTVA